LYSALPVCAKKTSGGSTSSSCIGEITLAYRLWLLYSKMYINANYLSNCPVAKCTSFALCYTSKIL